MKVIYLFKLRWKANKHLGGSYMTKKTKKDGGTKQKGKGSKGNKTSGSANGSNGYH